ncbi:MAG TPA: hypothetical protein HA282_01555 [Nanoarchaeota archaeon]|nr:hypothetical protein [Candidatus Pacearchaeota archaeon]HIH17864.1 hypothetical protein [Nanoarchaeota archaeon]HIH34804.1 hypothetical protein [Nanoarchaeota archaeon]HIH51235.1 hypothetical protein [Nanoarchaeota archaeon]HIH65884.1 hypothetical protein [Nanoarchaeota archaeon]
MKQGYYLILGFIAILGVALIITYSGNKQSTSDEVNTPNLTIKEKIYDWDIELILCQECSPYNEENISQAELERIKDEFISNFGEGEVIFERFGKNGFFLKVTNEAVDKMGGAVISGARIQTFYTKIIVDEGMQKEPSKDDEIYLCKEDRECISISPGCCGCGSGGEAITINRDYLNYWRNKLSAECEDMLCTAVISDHWTCYAKPKCIGGKCQLIR